MGAKGCEGLEGLRRIKTSKRDYNSEVLNLGDRFIEHLRKSSSASDTVAQRERVTEQYVLDFNLIIANEREIAHWQRTMHSICTLQQDLLPCLFRALITQAKTFHDKSEYNDYGFAREIRPGMQPIIRSLDELRDRCVKLIQSQTLGKEFDTQAFKLFQYVLSHHPKAEQKLHGLIAITVEQREGAAGERRGKCRVLTLKYDVSVREDGLESDTISYTRCLSNMYDPNDDRVRDIIADTVVRYLILYKHTRGTVMVDTIRQLMPPPEFQQINGQFVEPRRTQRYILNYVRFMLALMHRCNLRTVDNALVDESLELYRYYKELQMILFDYLHLMEAERADEQPAQSAADDPVFDIWLRKQGEELLKLMKTKRDALTPDQWEKAKEKIKDRELMYEKYLEVRTEDETAGLITAKLDAVFCAVLSFYRSEYALRKPIMIRRSIYDRYFADMTRLPGLVAAAPVLPVAPTSPLMSPWSTSRPPSPINSPAGFSVENGGILSEDGSSAVDDVQSVTSHSGAARAQIPALSVLFSHVYDDFEKCCFSAAHTPLLPSLLFGIINLHFDDLNPLLLSRMLQTAQSRDCDPRFRERIVEFLIGYAMRADRLSAPYLEQIASVLSDELLHEVKLRRQLPETVTPTKKQPALRSATLISTLFTGVMEILSARWSVLREDIETHALVRIILILAYALRSHKNRLLRATSIAVISQFESQLQRFDLSHSEPASELIKILAQAVKKRGRKSIMHWPDRPFALSDLRHYHSNIEDFWYPWEERLKERVGEEPQDADNSAGARMSLGVSLTEDIWDTITHTVVAEPVAQERPSAIPVLSAEAVAKVNKAAVDKSARSETSRSSARAVMKPAKREMVTPSKFTSPASTVVGEPAQSEHALSNHAPSTRVPSEHAPSERASCDLAPSDRAPIVCAPSERAPSEDAQSEADSGSKAATENVRSEHAANVSSEKSDSPLGASNLRGPELPKNGSEISASDAEDVRQSAGSVAPASPPDTVISELTSADAEEQEVPCEITEELYVEIAPEECDIELEQAESAAAMKRAPASADVKESADTTSRLSSALSNISSQLTTSGETRLRIPAALRDKSSPLLLGTSPVSTISTRCESTSCNTCADTCSKLVDHLIRVNQLLLQEVLELREGATKKRRVS